MSQEQTLDEYGTSQEEHTKAKVGYACRFGFGILFFLAMTKLLHWGLFAGGIDSTILRGLLVFFVGLPWVAAAFKLPGEFLMFFGVLTSSDAKHQVGGIDALRDAGRL